MSYRLGVATSRLAAVSRQTMHGVRRAGMSSLPGTKAPPGGYAPVPKYLAEKMKHFQLPNNLPVHIKGGAVDKLLYFLTAGVCTVGFIDCFRVYYALSYPKV